MSKGPEPEGIYNKIKTNKLISRLRTGQSRQGACDSVGLNMATFNTWLNLGKDPIKYPKEAAFRDRVKNAESECEHKWLNQAVSKAENSRDIMDIMSRRFKGRWAKQDNTKVELTGANGPTIIISTEEAREQLASRMDSALAKFLAGTVVEVTGEPQGVSGQLAIPSETETDPTEG